MLMLMRNFINGMVVGIAEIIPGISGGTVAVILGFYFDFIEAVNHFRENIKKHLFLLLPLLAGMAFSILAFGTLIDYLLLHHSLPTMLLFIGLIMGIIPIIFTKAKDSGTKGFKLRHVLMIAISILVLALASYLKSQEAVVAAEVISGIGPGYMAFIFFAGWIAAMALVLPGVSGSFVLLLLGVYPLVTHSISGINDWLGNISDTEKLLNICKVLGPLGIGVVAGVLSMVKLLEKFLEKYPKSIYSVISGLLLGSVYALFNDPAVYSSGVSPLTIAIGVAAFAAGAATSFLLGKRRL
ncbi:MAG: DUF368 domain-containing protein [Oscillospiraceae bacterium]|nr:DUF368 domain-containing protein [Oscillospiraceae bacterium]